MRKHPDLGRSAGILRGDVILWAAFILAYAAIAAVTILTF